MHRIFAFNPPHAHRSMSMPGYGYQSGFRRSGYARRPASRNPLVGRTGRPLSGAALKAAQRSVAKGRVPRGVRYVASSGATRIGRPKRKLKSRVAKARRLMKRARRVAAGKKAARTRKRNMLLKARARKTRVKSIKRSTKKRRASAGKKKAMAKSTKRSRAAKKAARTRKKNKAMRRAAAKRGARRRGGKSRSKLRVRKTKLRATVVSVKRGKRRAKLAFLLPKGKKSRKYRARLRRAKVRFNPGVSTGGGFMATLKSVFSMETLKVVGGGLAGFSLGAGLGEAAARAIVKDRSSKTYQLVGLAGGILASTTGGWLISKYSPTLGLAFFWGGLLGTAIRALAMAWPGKGFDVPKSAAEADLLATRLHAMEGSSNLASQALQAQSVANQALAAAGLPQVRDYLPTVDDYANVGTQDYLNVGGGNPLAGHGQNW